MSEVMTCMPFEQLMNWVLEEKKTKVGYEIPFTRYFYKYVPPKPSEDIMAEIKELEKSLDGVLEGIFND